MLRAVIGYEDLYEVSEVGSVWSCPKKKHDGMWLTPTLRKGYLTVHLSQDGIAKILYVHSLVAEAWIGPRPSGLQINHLDGNKLNNRVENLEYTTALENQRHAIRTGLVDTEKRIAWARTLGSRPHLHARKLTASDVREIRRRMAGEESVLAISRRFHVHEKVIYKIAHSMTYKEVA